jgi:CheY-like chemotaxis protein
MDTPNKPRVLCVDDEPNILEGLAVNLGRSYHVITAPSAQRALEVLRDTGEPIAIIISDMRMPVMDGAAFLSRARAIRPEAVRILLTGQSDIDSAIAAINDGQIFRFLTKPCLPSTLRTTLESALRQYELVTAEKVLLEQTLRGSIQALVDVLALSNPALFGRALRLKLLASELATKLDVKQWWHIEVAAMLSQLGYIALPAETFDRVQSNQPLTGEEAAMMLRAPAIAEQLIANIPRLEHVRGILSFAAKDPAAAEAASVPETVRRGSAILRVAADFDALDARGISSARIVDMLRSKPSTYDEATLNALESIRGIRPRTERVIDVHISALRPGMVLAKDVRTQTGILLAARGYQVTPGFVERAHNFREKLGRTISVLAWDRAAAGTESRVEELEAAGC